jgi:hypothetical protein
LQKLLWPGGDDHRGRRVAGGFGGQAEDLAAVEAVARPQRCGPGAQQGIDEAFAVLAGGIADRWRLSGRVLGDPMGPGQQRRAGVGELPGPLGQRVAVGARSARPGPAGTCGGLRL